MSVVPKIPILFGSFSLLVCQTFHSEVTGLILWATREPPRGVALIG